MVRRGLWFLTALAAFLSAGVALAQTDLAGVATGIPLPLPSGFRLSGGFSINGNSLTIDALPNGTGTVTLNRMTYSAGGSVPEGNFGFRDLAPYAGLGFTRMLAGGVKFSADAGAVFGGPPLSLQAAPLPGLPENLSLQYQYLEEREHTNSVVPLAKMTFSLRF